MTHWLSVWRIQRYLDRSGRSLYAPDGHTAVTRALPRGSLGYFSVEAVTDFFFLGSRITAHGNCSHEIKRCLLLGRKVVTDLNSVLESRDITLPTKVYLAQAVVFPVVTYGCESWTIKKVERQRVDAFELWCWRRLLRVPWTEKRSNQSILKEINLEYSPADWCWSLSSNTLASWCDELTHWKSLWCWEGLRAGGEGDDRGRDGWITSLIQRTWVWANSTRRWKTRKPGVLQFMVSQKSDTT